MSCSPQLTVRQLTTTWLYYSHLIQNGQLFSLHTQNTRDIKKVSLKYTVHWYWYYWTNSTWKHKMVSL